MAESIDGPTPVQARMRDVAKISHHSGDCADPNRGAKEWSFRSSLELIETLAHLGESSGMRRIGCEVVLLMRIGF